MRKLQLIDGSGSNVFNFISAIIVDALNDSRYNNKCLYFYAYTGDELAVLTIPYIRLCCQSDFLFVDFFIGSEVTSLAIEKKYLTENNIFYRTSCYSNKISTCIEGVKNDL